MRSWTPLSVAVVGALLLGGATTGTTRASWTSRAGTGDASLGTAAMSLTAEASPASITVPHGSSVTTVITVADSSSLRAKHLQQRLTPTLVGTLPTGVTAALTTRVNGTCTGTAQTPVTTTPGLTRAFCLTVNVAVGTAATSATVTVRIAGQQLRGNTPAGWTATPRTVSVPVAIPVPPAAPVSSCIAANQNGLKWTAVPGATGYVVTSSTTQTGTYADLTSQTGTSYPPTLAGQSTTFFRVRATGPGGSSTASNTIRLVRSGNSYTCTAVTP
ncbi:MAG TPA: hypothetical protein VD814_08390 [Nocardioides sp.]|nr:hypothetical protein [Nocardioides sp.]